MKKLKKYSLITLIIFSILSLAVPKVYADFDWPSPSESAQEAAGGIEDKYGLDNSELYNAAQTLNVSRQKKQNPQVSLTFTPSDPTPGEQVTATAAPVYFMNTNENLYFTWYLKTDKDLNGDGDVDIEDYKINAARIIASNDYEYENADYTSDSDDDGFSAPQGGKDQKGKNDYCYMHDQVEGNEYEIKECSHLFPNAPDKETGDGTFGAGEEEFWHTNPNDPDTAGTGNMDEANVAGVGISSFTWTYASGDTLGVAVEGISSEPTQKQDSSYKIMFAIQGDGCGSIGEYFDDLPETTEESSDETVDNGDGTSTTTTTTVTTTWDKNDITGYAQSHVTTTVTTSTTDNETGEPTGDPTSESETVDNWSDGENLFNMTMEDINQCLADNMVEPSEGGGSKEDVEVSLSYTPDSPMNDESGSENGDELAVTATTTNVDNPDYLNYTWQVYRSDESNPDDWGDALLKSELPGATQTSGIGLDTLKFNLNFDDPPKYLKIKLNVSESTSSGSSKEGHGSVIIALNSSSNKIKVYTTTVSSSLTFSKNDQICVTDDEDDPICAVAKDEIIAVEASGGNLTSFSWTKNGEAIECVSGGCSNTGESSNLTYFPILEENGESFSVSLTAQDESSGEKVELTKSFQVVVPKISLFSKDSGTCTADLMGYYEDLDGNQWPDYSEHSFKALGGSTASFGASFFAFSPEDADVTWYVDDEFKKNGDSVSFTTDENTGSSHSVVVSAIYKPDTNTKKALNQYWGVNLDEFYEKTITDYADISVSDSLENTESAKNNPKKILASLYSGLPEYMLFLFRIVLTTFLMISIMWLVQSISFIPQKNNN